MKVEQVEHPKKKARVYGEPTEMGIHPAGLFLTVKIKKKDSRKPAILQGIHLDVKKNQNISQIANDEASTWYFTDK